MKKILLGLVLFLLISQSYSQVTLPDGFVIEEITDQLTEPTDFRFAPDGRIFIAEKGGDVRIIENGVLLETPFYSVLTQQVNERGLDGICLDPDFDENGVLYLFYTLPDQNKSRISKVVASGNTAVPNSEEEIWVTDNMWGSFHNGAAMVIDATGKLVVGTGDGTGGGAGQDVTIDLGKILRMNTDGTIPEDNPYYDIFTNEERAIVGYGVRNPYTMAVSKRSGKIFFNDVGQDAYEEVNELVLGANYGHNLTEGPLGSADAPDSNYTDPVYYYAHEGEKCAVVGASFYEPDVMLYPEEYDGKYFFMDYCEGSIHYMDPDTYEVTQMVNGLFFPNNLEVSPDGYLYFVERIGGKLFRLIYTGGDSPPFFTTQPHDVIVGEGGDAEFGALVIGADVSYQWYVNDTTTEVAGATSDTLMLSDLSLADDGNVYFLKASNAFGATWSDSTFLTVIDGQAPQISIDMLASDYRAGDTLHFVANIIDPDQQGFEAQNIQWMVDFHHLEHTHPALSWFPADSGAYIVPTSGEPSPQVYYRVYLMVTDSSGLVTTIYEDVQPILGDIIINSVPEGIHVSVDAMELPTPTAVETVENLTRLVEVPAYEVLNDSLYSFVDWSDGETLRFRNLSTAHSGITANYQNLGRWYDNDQTFGIREFYSGTAVGENQQLLETTDVEHIYDNWDILNPFPWLGYPSDSTSMKWMAKVTAPITGEYSFYMRHDGRLTFVFGGDTLINNSLSPNEYRHVDTVTVDLIGGNDYSLRVDYDHYAYISRVELWWEFSVIPAQLVPLDRDPAVDTVDPSTLKNTLSVFPSPTDDKIFLRTGDGIEFVSGAIYATNGEQMMSFDGGVFEVDVNALKPGLYVVSVQTREGDDLRSIFVKQ